MHDQRDENRHRRRKIVAHQNEIETDRDRGQGREHAAIHRHQSDTGKLDKLFNSLTCGWIEN